MSENNNKGINLLAWDKVSAAKSKGRPTFVIYMDLTSLYLVNCVGIVGEEERENRKKLERMYIGVMA